MTNISLFQYAFKIALFYGGPAVATNAAIAQEETALDPNKIVVTAQKRVQAIGVTVSALGKESLSTRSAGRVGAGDAGLGASGQPVWPDPDRPQHSRRVAERLSGLTGAPIAFYNDEVYISTLGTLSGMTHDIERVEVLRRPEGKLFGRSATGGLIQIVSASQPTISTASSLPPSAAIAKSRPRTRSVAR